MYSVLKEYYKEKYVCNADRHRIIRVLVRQSDESSKVDESVPTTSVILLLSLLHMARPQRYKTQEERQQAIRDKSKRYYST